MNHNKYCRKCGAFIPAWADVCLSCGDGDIKPKIRSAKTVNLDDISRGDRVRFHDYLIKNCYIGSEQIQIEPIYGGRDVDGRLQNPKKKIIKIDLSIIGETE